MRPESRTSGRWRRRHTPWHPPVKLVVPIVPRFAVSTLKAALPLEDIWSPYFQALVPLISPESVPSVWKDCRVAVRVAFKEIESAATPCALASRTARRCSPHAAAR